MKKIIYTHIVLLIFPMFLFAQLNTIEPTHKIKKYAISVNLTSPLIQAINRNKPDSSSLRIATNIAVSKILGKKWLMRVGFGGYNNYQTISNDIYRDRKIENYNRISGLFSFYRINNITDNWVFGIGPSFSAVYNHIEKLNDSGFDIVNSYEYTKGGGAGLGVFFEYNINKRLSIFSEYSVLYNIYETAEGKEFSAFPDQSYARNKLLNQGIQFQFPIAIYVNYHF